MKRYTTIGILLIAGLLAGQVNADEITGRLKRIKENAIIVIAHGETTMPFSYVDRGGPIGFGVDISKRIADGIKIRLNLPELRIRWNPVTLATRFPLMVTNTVDLECVTTTHTRSREELVGFSNTFYISDEGIAVRGDSTIKSHVDLAGKRIAVARGTTTERNLQTKGLDTKLVAERNNRLAMAALAEGSADAYVAAVPVIAGELLRLDDAKPFRIVSSNEHHEAFACMLPKNDPALKKAVDEILAEMMKSGEMERIYNKWFMEPIPPYGRKVNLPLNENNRQLYLAPNDRPFE